MKSIFAAFVLVTIASANAMADVPEIITRPGSNILDKSVRLHAPGMTIPQLRGIRAKSRAQQTAQQTEATPVAQTDSNKSVAPQSGAQ